MRIPAYKDTIMVHCLATSKDWGEGKSAEKGVEEVRQWHTRERGWKDIGYTEVCDYQGHWAPGRDLDKDGDIYEEINAAAKGWNKNAIHLALFGGRGASANDKFEDHFTPAQDLALRNKIAEIEAAAGRKMRLMGHNEVAAKGCPGFNVREWYENKAPRNLAQSKTMQGAGAATVGAVGTGATAISQLEGNAQIVSIVMIGLILGGLAWVFRARIQDWARGRR